MNEKKEDHSYKNSRTAQIIYYDDPRADGCYIVFYSSRHLKSYRHHYEL